MPMASRVLQLVLVAPLLVLLSLTIAIEAASTSNDITGRSPAPSQSVFSLDDYGAVGDGTNDDTQALASAWNAACSSSQPATVLVPGGKCYLLKLITLAGPCKSSSVAVSVQGTLVASPDRSDWSEDDTRHWIVFRRVDKLTVNGGGTVDGNGEAWWKYSCKINKALVSLAPHLLFSSCKFSFC
ncbi:hypothetical protein QOZ80_3AG0211540 [Eleusine coracana subsp. coracana]|nr:hypothetical protein QOZ80_3AG0211540 [Eleusine coracana subsp. coracana]